jgi:hypothetical protein
MVDWLGQCFDQENEVIVRLEPVQQPKLGQLKNNFAEN